MSPEEPDNQGSAVVAEVEVIFFNLLKKRGLVLGALAEGDGSRRALLRGPIVDGEQPSSTARRLLETVAGVTTAAHEPELVSARVAVHRQLEGPTITLSYVVMGAIPSDSRYVWRFSEAVDVRRPSLEERIDDAGAVRAARRAAARLLEEIPVAPALLPRPGQPFTLAELHWVYSTVIGPEWRMDLANFRRKIERVPGLVERAPAPPSGKPQPAKRGRRPIWYVHGAAKQLDRPFRFQ